MVERLIPIIIIPLFIIFGDKNYGNITKKFKTLHMIYTYQIKLSLAPLGINDCLCLYLFVEHKFKACFPALTIKERDKSFSYILNQWIVFSRAL